MGIKDDQSVLRNVPRKISALQTLTKPAALLLMLCFWILTQHRPWSPIRGWEEERESGATDGRKDLTVLRTASGPSLISHHLTVVQNNSSSPNPWLRPSRAADPPAAAPVELNVSPFTSFKPTTSSRAVSAELSGMKTGANQDTLALLMRQLRCDAAKTARLSNSSEQPGEKPVSLRLS